MYVKGMAKEKKTFQQPEMLYFHSEHSHNQSGDKSVCRTLVHPILKGIGDGR